MATRLLFWLATLLGASSGCDSNANKPPARTSTSSSAPGKKTSPNAANSTSTERVPWRFPKASRLVAIGDVHGDYEATKKVLRLAGLVDSQLRWAAADTVVVQTGDVLDRGDGEQAILDLFARLEKEAAAAGGAFRVLHGNHELMNVAGDMRYVTPGGFSDFQDAPGVRVEQFPMLGRLPPRRRARYAAFLPGGAYARKIAKHPVVVVVGDTVFAHGGVLPKHVRYGIDRLNSEVSSWLLGKSSAALATIQQSDSPVWSRHFSHEPDAEDCALLAKTLQELGVKRMVVGHTVQRQILPACDKRVWRIDVGMSAHYGGKAQALQLVNGKVTVLGKR